jgi:hypothetical protein
MQGLYYISSYLFCKTGNGRVYIAHLVCYERATEYAVQGTCGGERILIHRLVFANTNKCEATKFGKNDIPI